ncbi:cytosine transporter [Vibrio nigripulchritudo MADA3029]|uniref:cytosine permease n=1 Tax=Vibrio nigripulchritudo TaxID=28173 RepID=UPI0003B1D954|nr:cytosine permease [Vibrio nigripulchritudo]CCN49520.1 cytosine transporter [Vibrio nigripulchritudo MADA3020]CCN51357.1 cytosine transporter [Vibrio nigripulchritudo MADA3021]CCN59992.1 cytosine transporter [Vibrio nigripulchritudo MADA3029]CCN70906.1 cytosine transporter [Vibrio nigripulchritudo SFn118]BCL73044.1 cytosine permease [Vibrio nigripulchritudo]
MIFDENFSLRPVPYYARKRTLALGLVLVGLTFFSASMQAGGVVWNGLSSSEFVWVVLIGNLMLATYAGVLGYIGSTTGLSTHLLTHFSFGHKGSWLPSLILGGTQVGWFGVGVAMFAIPVSKVTGVDVKILIAVSGLLMVSTAYFGMSALIFLSAIAVPAILLFGGYSVKCALETFSVGALYGELGDMQNKLTMSEALTLVVGTFVSAATLSADFLRFAKNHKKALIITALAFFAGNTVMFVLGALSSYSIGYADLFDTMLAQGLLIPAIVVLGLNIWTTNDNALYASGLAFSNITRLPSHHLSVLNGFLGTIFALWLHDHFIDWLHFLSIAIPPVGGVIIADYLTRRREYLDYANVEFEEINWCGIAAVALGVFGALTIPGIGPVNAVIVAMTSYWVLQFKPVKAWVSRSI